LLSSGDRSREYALGREIRSAYFLGKAGWTAQHRAGGSFIFKHRVYKLVANLIWDWHWLAADYDFNGIGDLVWVPHYFGGLGMARPTIYDSTDFRLEDGLFASLGQLGQCRMYAVYGFRKMRSHEKDHVLYFEDAGYDLDRRARIDDHERHYWGKLLDIYCQMNSSELNAMATCRTAGAALLSVRAQLVRWRRHVRIALTALVEGRSQGSEIAEHFERAQGCASEFLEKQRIWDGIGPVIARAQSLAAGITDLRDRVPAVADVELYGHAAAKLQDLRAFNDIVGAVHFLVMQVAALARAERAETEGIETKLRIIAADIPELPSNLCDASGWITDSLSPNAARNVAERCRDLAEAVLDAISESTGVAIPRKKDFHMSLVGDHYPLPRESFKPGF
jgi:hypothetical protein